MAIAAAVPTVLANRIHPLLNSICINSTGTAQAAQKSREIDQIENQGRGVDYQNGKITSVPFPSRCENGPVKRVFHEPGVFYWPPPIVKKCTGLHCPHSQMCEPQKTVTRFVWAICFKWWIPIGIKQLCVKDELQCRCKPRCKQFICFPPRQFNPHMCDCECPNTCRPPLTLDKVSCRCKCPPINCTPPQVLNPLTCRCECPIHAPPCFPGKFDPRTCRCITSPCFRPCPSGRFMDSRICECVPWRGY